MKDPLEPASNKLPSKLTLTDKDSKIITVDSSNSFYQSGFSFHTPTPTLEEQKLFDILNANEPYQDRANPKITIDQTNLQISDSNTRTYYPNSVSNWQERFKTWRDDNNNGFATERNYLPLWMRSIQPGTKEELGFVLAIPLCFCFPGKADEILLNIKHSEFDFTQLDYTIDRYIIDAVEGYTSDKYLVFKNDRNTIT
jgi:hypothetical protein